MSTCFLAIRRASQCQCILVCNWYCYWLILVNYFYQRSVKPVVIWPASISIFFLLENQNKNQIQNVLYFFWNIFSWSWTLELTRLFNSFPYFSLANFCYNLVHSKWFSTVVTVNRNFALWRRLIAWKLFRNTSFFVNITLITFSASMAENIGTAKTFLAVIHDKIFARWHIILIKWT